MIIFVCMYLPGVQVLDWILHFPVEPEPVATCRYRMSFASNSLYSIITLPSPSYNPIEV